MANVRGSARTLPADKVGFSQRIQGFAGKGEPVRSCANLGEQK
jgi:hypothetical protein